MSVSRLIDAAARSALPVFLPVLLSLVILPACTGTEWLEVAPTEIVGTWVRVSDEITLGFERPDTINVSPTALSRYAWAEDERVVQSGRIRAVSRKGSRLIVFWGELNERRIAQNRYQFELERSGWFARIGELVATGVNNDDAFFVLGRYVYRNR